MKKTLLILMLFATGSAFAEKFANGFIQNKDTIYYEKGKLSEQDKQVILKIYNEIKNTDSKDPIIKKENNTFYHYKMRGKYMDFLVTDDATLEPCFYLKASLNRLTYNPRENLDRLVNRTINIGICSFLGLIALKIVWGNTPSSFIDSLKNLFSTYTKNAQ